MDWVFGLLRRFIGYVGLLSIRSALIVGGVLWLINRLVLPDVPVAVVAILALILNPPVIAGLWLHRQLRRFGVATQRVCELRTDESADPALRRAMARFGTLYRTREWLTSPTRVPKARPGREPPPPERWENAKVRRAFKLENAVVIAYGLQALLYRFPGDRGANTVHGPEGEGIYRLTAEHFRRKKAICDFVVDAWKRVSLRVEAMNRFTENLGARRRIFVEILDVTNTDGDGTGYFSTLTCLHHVDLLLVLPEALTDAAQIALEDLRFDLALFGWLAHRVLEAVILLVVVEHKRAGEAVHALQPVVSEIEHTLVRQPAAERDRRQWDGRNRLRTLVGSTRDYREPAT